MAKLMGVVWVAVVVALAAACGSSSTPAAPTAERAPSADWPMLGHDLRSSFSNAGESMISTATAGSLHQAWQSTEQGTVNGTPAIVDGTVYVLGSGGTYAFDGSSGAVRWANKTVQGTSSPTVDNGVVFVNDRASVLHALRASDGSELWRATIDAHPMAGGFSSPVVAGGKVIVGSASTEEVSARTDATFRGSLVAFDAATGAEVWRHATAQPPDTGVAIWSSSAIDEDAGVVYATTGNNYTGDAGATSDSIFAVRLVDGGLVWNRQLSEGDVFTIGNPRSPDSDFGTNPILFDATIDGTRRELVGAGQKSGMFWALDRTTGETVWSRQVSGGSSLIGGIFNNGAYDGERLLVAGNNGTSTGAGSEPSNGLSNALGLGIATTSVLEALDPATGNVIWERQLGAWVWAPITVANGVGFVSSDRELQAFDVATGEVLQRISTGGTIASGAAIAGGRVYWGSGLGYFGTKIDTVFHAAGVSGG